MPSERIQRRIDSLLDEADEAVKQRDWSVVRERAESALRMDPENPDALAYLAAADRDTSAPAARTGVPETSPVSPPAPVATPQPTSFANIR